MLKRPVLPFLTLFASASTLVCCALPALFVALGAGAAFAGIVGQFPQLIWLSEHKIGLFMVAGLVLIVAGIMQYQARNLPCPIDARAAEACARARRWSKLTYAVSVAIYLVGAGFAFLPPFLTGS